MSFAKLATNKTQAGTDISIYKMTLRGSADVVIGDGPVSFRIDPVNNGCTDYGPRMAFRFQCEDAKGWISTESADTNQYAGSLSGVTLYSTSGYQAENAVIEIPWIVGNVVEAGTYTIEYMDGAQGSPHYSGYPTHWNDESSGYYMGHYIVKETGSKGPMPGDWGGFYTHDAAEAASVGDTKTLELPEGIILFFFYDNYPNDNEGGITYKVYRD